MIKNLYITIGLPASGKSTWCAARAQEGWSWHSRDKIRFSLTREDESYFAHDDEAFDVFIANIQNDINDNIENIIVDATHLTNGSRNKILNRLTLKGYLIHYVYFNTPFETCLERNRARAGRECVPDEVMERMNGSLTIPNPELNRILIIEGE